MPMPDPTGDTGKDYGFFNEQRVWALLLVMLLLVLLGFVIWIALNVSSIKEDRAEHAFRLPAKNGETAFAMHGTDRFGSPRVSKML